MDALYFILWPIVWLMNAVLSIYISIVGSVGLSILLLSATFAAVLTPLRNYASRWEKRVSDRRILVNADLADVKGKLWGEKLFLATEKVYEKHGYHPVHDLASALGFATMLPVLLSAILLFDDNPKLTDTSFLLIDDLSQPDRLIFGLINFLPIAMFLVTILDSRIRFADDQSAHTKFLIIATVFLVLVYTLPSGLVLYWLGSSVFTLVLAIVAKWKTE